MFGGPWPWVQQRVLQGEEHTGAPRQQQHPASSSWCQAGPSGSLALHRDPEMGREKGRRVTRILGEQSGLSLDKEAAPRHEFFRGASGVIPKAAQGT